jgi:hypothetical protein
MVGLVLFSVQDQFEIKKKFFRKWLQIPEKWKYLQLIKIYIQLSYQCFTIHISQANPHSHPPQMWPQKMNFKWTGVLKTRR